MALSIRLFNRLSSSSLLVMLSPLLITRALLGYLKTGAAFEREPLLGYQQRPFKRLSFAGRGFGKNWAVLFNLVRGELAWTGMRPLTKDQAAQLTPSQSEQHFNFPAGLISPYRVRQKIGVAYDDESAVDSAFFAQANLKNTLSLCAKALINQLLDGNATRPMPERLHFWGVDLLNTNVPETLDWFVDRLQTRQQTHVTFVNAACLNIAYHHSAYRHILQTAARALPDGIGIALGCRLLNIRMQANINGTDLFPRLCERVEQTGHSLFLLGGMAGVAERCAQAMLQRYPRLRIAGVHEGYFDDDAAVIAKINASGAAILLVGFGVPKQELWLAAHQHALQATLLLGIGGLFDYYSGRIARAPQWLRDIGFEWTWRLIQEPSRLWQRYLIGNPLFLYRVAKQAWQRK